MLTNLLYILLALLILGICIIGHELGHFIVGRMCGIGVIEFSIGFGPKLFGWRRGETDYSVRVLPLGGYCKFVGEDDDNPAPNAMNRMPVWKRFLTVLAGPGMNFVLAYAAAVIALSTMSYVSDVIPKVDFVMENTPAWEAQLQSGDVVIAVDGIPISYDSAGIEVLRAGIREKDSIDLTISRSGEELNLTLAPAVVTQANGTQAKQIGVSFTALTARYTVPEAFRHAGSHMLNAASQMLGYLRNLIFQGKGAEDLAGAVGMVTVMSQELQQNSSLFLDYLFMISLNLGIMNLLPLPALDGGRLVFLAVEAVRRKPVPPEKEGLVHAIGLILLLILAVVLMWHDIVTYIL